MIAQLLRSIPRYELSTEKFLLVVFIVATAPIIVLFAFESSQRRGQKLQPRGCRKLGLRAKSNIADEYNSEYGKAQEPGQDKNGVERWRVKSLWIYPIKSCRGVELNRGTVVSTGMQYDRQFCFALWKERPAQSSSVAAAAAAAAAATASEPNDNIDSKKGGKEKEMYWKFITQRDHPLLALVETEVWVPDPASPGYSLKAQDVQGGGVLVIKFPGKRYGIIGTLLDSLFGAPQESFRVPLDPTAEQIKARGFTRDNMTVWKDSPLSLKLNGVVPREFGQFLRLSETESLSLFRVDKEHYREVFKCAPRADDLGYQPITGFADSYPLHIQNLASVRDVGERVKSQVPNLSVLRFRPNIIVTGPEAYAEDSWKKLRIGQDVFHVSCRTTRCKLPNNDPDTGVKNKVEPDRTLRAYRCIDEGSPKHACLGMMMVASSQLSTVKVGDKLDVLETGDHFYL
ncbi:hypothetical protein L228DRAFT_244169 [Xylona heveae TC161]|uniref:MOSC domain-containing protein n=1 Tax=Xylona heveae (strain CBS 132557 / TC161) TaxID=1328760 RepID=A0A165IT55_XYLHT|nr:hypothetical protein L228DRAFT_244169 [Xylona heveae TC161]KZF25351.1 hypothetical protein L228DRAFT_244169 [Xylona heveae TC161]